AILNDECAIGIGHFQTVDHHYGADGDLDTRASQAKHLRNVSILEIEFPGKFVIFLIKGAAGNENSDGHGSICAEPMHLSKFVSIEVNRPITPPRSGCFQTATI